MKIYNNIGAQNQFLMLKQVGEEVDLLVVNSAGQTLGTLLIFKVDGSVFRQVIGGNVTCVQKGADNKLLIQ